MKMVAFLESKAVARAEQQKSIHGGVGYSGIAATVCASAMNKGQNLTDTSI